VQHFFVFLLCHFCLSFFSHTSRYRRVLELRSRNSKYITLTDTDVPDFQHESQRLHESVTRLRAELVEAENQKRSKVDRLQTLETLQSTCAEVSRLAGVIREMEPDIQHERDSLYMCVMIVRFLLFTQLALSCSRPSLSLARLRSLCAIIRLVQFSNFRSIAFFCEKKKKKTIVAPSSA
jgi:hypothetical protein